MEFTAKRRDYLGVRKRTSGTEKGGRQRGMYVDNFGI